MNTFRMINKLAGLLAGITIFISTQAVADSQMYFVHTDQLGMPQVLTDRSQRVVWEVSQTPFGEVSASGNVEQPYRFPGQYADPETGYSYNYFRDYDTNLGRYLQSDPIGLQGGLNTYGYVKQNPVVLVDPYGLDAEAALAALPAAIAVAMADSPIPGPMDIVAGLGLAALAVMPGDAAKTEDRAIPQPDRPKKGVTCTCRAASNGLQEGNCPEDEYAFGTATASTKRVARAEAERIARRNLGKQAKHTQCKCTDNKGNPVY